MSTENSLRSIAAIALCLVALQADGEERPALEVTAPDGAVTVGDLVPVRVSARGGDDWLWGELQVRVEKLGPWEVVDGPRAVAGARPLAWELVLAPMEVGELDLPELTSSVRSPDGEAVTVRAEVIPKVEIGSVLPPEGEVEPAPVKDPIGVRGFPWEWVVPVAAGAAPVLALLLWWLHRRRKSAADDPGFRLPPIDQLHLLLSELETKVGREPAAGICDRLASGFRRYLERRTGEPAQEMTSFELRRLARRSAWPEPVERSIHRVMEVVDGVRFGRRRVAEAELKGAVKAAGEAGQGLESHLVALEQELEAAS